MIGIWCQGWRRRSLVDTLTEWLESWEGRSSLDAKCFYQIGCSILNVSSTCREGTTIGTAHNSRFGLHATYKPSCDEGLSDATEPLQ